MLGRIKENLNRRRGYELRPEKRYHRTSVLMLGQTNQSIIRLWDSFRALGPSASLAKTTVCSEQDADAHVNLSHDRVYIHQGIHPGVEANVV